MSIKFKKSMATVVAVMLFVLTLSMSFGVGPIKSKAYTNDMNAFVEYLVNDFCGSDISNKAFNVDPGFIPGFTRETSFDEAYDSSEFVRCLVDKLVTYQTSENQSPQSFLADENVQILVYLGTFSDFKDLVSGAFIELSYGVNGTEMCFVISPEPNWAFVEFVDSWKESYDTPGNEFTVYEYTN